MCVIMLVVVMRMRPAPAAGRPRTPPSAARLLGPPPPASRCCIKATNDALLAATGGCRQAPNDAEDNRFPTKYGRCLRSAAKQERGLLEDGLILHPLFDLLVRQYDAP